MMKRLALRMSESLKGVAKLRLESREISISLWKKQDVETDIRQKDHRVSIPWEGKVDGLL